MISGSGGVVGGGVGGAALVSVLVSVLALASDVDWRRDDLNVLIRVLVLIGMARLALLLGRMVNANDSAIRILNDSKVNFILIAVFSIYISIG